jgi:signal transduction histidine kinase
MFQKLRIRLTLWYCGVLGLALILFGVALYLGTRYFLLSSVTTDAQNHAQAHKHQWLMDSPEHACPLLGGQDQPGPPGQGQGFFVSELVVCFDQNGSLLAGQDTTGLPAVLLTDSVARTALQTNEPATDIVDAEGSIGQVYLYALVVPDSANHGNRGVVVIGESVRAQESALTSLLTLLLSIGGTALLGAGLGGLFLANRALAPARLAWANQQRFIADASHEMRTPLTLLRADAEVLLREHGSQESDDVFLLENIVAETNHMATITTNLLMLARLDNSPSHQEHEVVNMAKIVLKGVQRVQASAEQRKIALQEEHTDQPRVIGDPLLLEQVVLILLDNAIKYNRDGGSVNVRTTVAGEQVLLEVRDNGIGISAEHLPYLGQRFYRADKARSRAAGGTGLGLSIAQSIVAAHGGQLTLNSVIEQGTIATLTLPSVREREM